MYHEIEADKRRPTERYSVTAETFESQLIYLAEKGFRTVPLHDLADSRDDARRVAITFDDTHLSHYASADPLLRKDGYQATFFVVGSFVGQKDEWLHRSHLEAMREGGMSIQSHSHTHRFLDQLSDKDLDHELRLSKHALEETTGVAVDFISCPGGRYERRVAIRAAATGYHGVCTSAPGLGAHGPRGSISVFGRFLVSASTGMDTFSRIAAGEARFVLSQRVRYGAKQTVKRIVGDALYDTLWRKYVRDL